MHGTSSRKGVAMLVEVTKNSNLRIEQIGGKAYSLQKLILADLNVPPLAVIVVDDTVGTQKGKVKGLEAKLSSLSFFKNSNLYAVRSSGVGEDGVENSYAGIFETCLNVSSRDIPSAVEKVYESLKSTESKMYAKEKLTSVTKMAVIVQEMIQADFAGVAFTVNPVERDTRIALIEVVSGIGESLVSGKNTPSAIRLNKLTGMHRVLRYGMDSISDEMLYNIASLLSDSILVIEKLYGMPTDIEWAIKDNCMYLLQARPITTLAKEKHE